MNSMKDYSTVEELNEFFSKKISLINEGIELKQVDHKSASFFRDFEISIIGLRELFQQIKDAIKEGEGQLAEMKALLKAMQSLDSKLDHMQKNFPEVLKPQVTAKREKVEAPVTTKSSKQTKVIAEIKCLTMQEFESLPKYMKGRLQYEQVNNFINEFNKAITAKYNLLRAPRKTMKPADYKLVNIMKSEETEETKGKYFCTAENMKDYSKIRMDKFATSILTILRHCGRIKEIRGPKSFIRYVIIE